MPLLPRSQPDVLPGADADADCQTSTADQESGLTTAVSPPEPQIEHDDDHDGDHDHEHEHDVTWDSVISDETGILDSWRTPQSGWAHFLERIALAIEKPVNKLTGSTQLNPFYHTGTIAVFLMVVVGLTGIYLFMFFQYGFDSSYRAVTRMEGQFIARTIRAVHRYASGAAVITTLLHAYRTLFMERFRGPRWLAWVTGIFLTIILWGAGVTGYWAIWDERAQLITASFMRLLDRFTPWLTGFQVNLAVAERTGASWPILLLIMVVHILLFLVSALFFWLHIRRLSRAKWLPDVQWVVGMGAVLLLGAIVFPVGMLPQASLLARPFSVTLDPIFLFFLPTSGRPIGLWLWIGLLVITVVGLALPWLPSRRRKQQSETAVAQPFSPPIVNIIKDRCTGCTKCALDCPYGAIVMVERHDDKPHKFIAIEDPSLCVGCGICIGSCDGVAVTMGDVPPELLWTEVSGRLALAQAKTPNPTIVFTCERHAAHGAKPYLTGVGNEALAEAVEVIAVPCAGLLPPDLLTRTLDAGAGDVKVIGCPLDDCVNREGNVWTAERLTRQRVPRLRRPYANAPITAVWLPPNQFSEALNTPPRQKIDEKTGVSEPDYLRSRRIRWSLGWLDFVKAFALLAIVMGVQIFTTDLPYVVPSPALSAGIQLVLPDPTHPFGEPLPAGVVADALELRVDGTAVYTYQYATPAEPIFVETAVLAGAHALQLRLQTTTGEAIVLFDEPVQLAENSFFQLGLVRVLRQRTMPPGLEKSSDQ